MPVKWLASLSDTLIVFYLLTYLHTYLLTYIVSGQNETLHITINVEKPWPELWKMQHAIPCLGAFQSTTIATNAYWLYFFLSNDKKGIFPVPVSNNKERNWEKSACSKCQTSQIKTEPRVKLKCDRQWHHTQHQSGHIEDGSAANHFTGSHTIRSKNELRNPLNPNNILNFKIT